MCLWRCSEVLELKPKFLSNGSRWRDTVHCIWKISLRPSHLSFSLYQESFSCWYRQQQFAAVKVYLKCCKLLHGVDVKIYIWRRGRFTRLVCWGWEKVLSYWKTCYKSMFVLCGLNCWWSICCMYGGIVRGWVFEFLTVQCYPSIYMLSSCVYPSVCHKSVFSQSSLTTQIVTDLNNTCKPL